MRDTILQLMSQRQGEYISGEELSRRLGVSRTAVWKHIQALREEGYVIDSQPRSGYRLLERPDLLLPGEVQAGLQTHVFGRQFHHYAEVGSTNDVARELANEGAPEGTVVVAEKQTRGRGRLGRNWFSPSGQGIWFSVILRPPLAPSEVTKITLVAAVAVARALRGLTGLDVRIKWPNDLLVGGKKLVGILTQLNAEVEKINYVVIGIGVNANVDMTTFPPEVRTIATSIRVELGQPFSRVKILQRILEELETAYQSFIHGGFPSLLQEWKQLSYTLGRWVKVTQPTEEVEGLATDVDEDGCLVLRLADGSCRRVIAGDVSF